MELEASLLSALLVELDSMPDVKEMLISAEKSLVDPNLVKEKLNQLMIYLREIPSSPRRLPVRIYSSVCMDITHSGHFNFMRQAKALGDALVIGIVSDEEVTKAKGPPVMSHDERKAMVQACKWVDEVVENVGYYMNLEILDRLHCDYSAHGDDVAIRKDTGVDANEEARKAGKMKIVKRTEGISTTELVGRMLLMTVGESKETNPTQVSALKSNSSNFLGSTRRINQFSADKMPPKAGDRIVYVDGSFDLLHVGHLETLKAAKALGDYLIVGVHDDKTVHAHKGQNYPIMNLNERTLNLLAMRYVDDVIMGAPWEITEDMIKTLNISLVVQGTLHKDGLEVNITHDPYELPKRLGIYREVVSTTNLNAEVIVRRIVDHRMLYIQRNTRMVANEAKYYENKEYVKEI